MSGTQILIDFLGLLDGCFESLIRDGIDDGIDLLDSVDVGPDDLFGCEFACANARCDFHSALGEEWFCYGRNGNVLAVSVVQAKEEIDEHVYEHVNVFKYCCECHGFKLPRGFVCSSPFVFLKSTTRCKQFSNNCLRWVIEMN